MEELEIFEKFRVNSTGEADSFFYDRAVIKLKSSKWKNFPAATHLQAYIDYHDRLKTFQVYKDDVFVVGFPRSGTTLLQEMVWLLDNKLNYEESKKVHSYHRCVWPELVLNNSYRIFLDNAKSLLFFLAISM
jgi:Sulfotransferase domain